MPPRSRDSASTSCASFILGPRIASRDRSSTLRAWTGPLAARCPNSSGSRQSSTGSAPTRGPDRMHFQRCDAPLLASDIKRALSMSRWRSQASKGGRAVWCVLGLLFRVAANAGTGARSPSSWWMEVGRVVMSARIQQPGARRRSHALRTLLRASARERHQARVVDEQMAWSGIEGAGGRFCACSGCDACSGLRRMLAPVRGRGVAGGWKSGAW
jgi:hypothetical protein